MPPDDGGDMDEVEGAKDDAERVEEELEDEADVPAAAAAPEVPEADAIEQAQSLEAAGWEHDRPLDAETPEADALEQRQTAGDDDDERR
jgi:hypothetical protein